MKKKKKKEMKTITKKELAERLVRSIVDKMIAEGVIPKVLYGVTFKCPAPVRGGIGCTCTTLADYDRNHDNGCSICRDPNCSEPNGKH